MIAVYVGDGGRHSTALLADLERRRIPFVCVNLSIEPRRAAELASVTRERRLPAVVDHERCSIGFAGASSTFDELGIDQPPGLG